MASRLLGIDYGLARIGLSLSDSRQILASPIGILLTGKTLEQTARGLLAKIASLEEEWGDPITTLVIGLPLMMSGKRGVQADEVQAFADFLQTLTDRSIITWDERLTTVQAERAMQQDKLTRKKRSKKVDTLAAVLILQSYLDHIG